MISINIYSPKNKIYCQLIHVNLTLVFKLILPFTSLLKTSEIIIPNTVATKPLKVKNLNDFGNMKFLNESSLKHGHNNITLKSRERHNHERKKDILQANMSGQIFFFKLSQLNTHMQLYEHYCHERNVSDKQI